MTTLLLVRHGETDWNAEGRLQGHTDTPLNDYGRRQARALADGLAAERLDAIYASDLAARPRDGRDPRRAARPLGRARPGPAREGLGHLGGTHVDRARRASSSPARRTEAHRTRTLAALVRIAARHPGGRVLVVTHGGSMRRVQAAVTGIALPVVENCGRWTCACEDGVFLPID